MQTRLFLLGLFLVALGGGCEGLRKSPLTPSDGGGGGGAAGSGGGVGAGGNGKDGGVSPDLATNVCVAGLSCIPANPCHEGETVCAEGGATTCNDTQRVKTNGSVCDDGSVCRGGACVVCAAGMTCPIATNPCRIGTTVCTTGASVCTESDNQIDGTPCGAGKVCQAGVCTACVAGGTCTPTNACHTGALVCAGGTSSCTDTTMNVAAGTSCGKDMVCDATGSCAACVSGSACVVAGNPCRVGMTVCNTGAPVCLESGNAPNGTSCGTGKVCSSGACVACTAGLACVPANPCHTGVTVCAPAISCTDTGTTITNGTSCGTGKVCSSGTCNACAAGNTCQPTDPCKAGTTSCATGVSTCVTSGNSPNGTACGANMVCTNGTCVACMAGASCPPTNPCHKGTLACDTGAAVCTDTTMSQPDGMTCGSNLVCRTGMCVSCTAGTSCQPTNVCKTGTTSCSTGSSVCVESGNKPNGMVCVSGTSGMVCNAGTCVACSNGGPCTPANPCHNGTQSCATGSATCTDLGTSLADGTPCGTMNNLFCKAGMCTSCTPGLTGCTTNPNPCKVGTTSCSTGSSVCVDGANKAVGASCGTNMVCNAASACVACTAGMSCTPPNNPCHQGTVACGTGAVVCTDTGTPAADGKNCGPATGSTMFCLGGICGTCMNGSACTPANPCKKPGTTSCATGLPVCVDGGNQTAGTACPPPQSCMAGVKTLASTCNGTGTCSPVAMMTCSSGVCSGTDCLTCTAGPQCGSICCASGQGCCGGVCQNLNTPTNCGACGHNCTLLSNVKAGATTCSASGGCTVPTGTSGCNAGFANCATVANDTDGCETPTNTNNNCGGCNVPCSFPTGVANCSTGTCVTSCVAGQSHLCGSTCQPNNDTTHCAASATTCTDCTQANANAVCGNPCNNTCVGLRLCAGVGGKPNCGSWTFESQIPADPTEGWIDRLGADSSNALVSGSIATTASPAPPFGLRSLSVGFNGNGGAGGRFQLRVKVNLCSGNTPIDLLGRTIRAQIRFTHTTGAAPPAGSVRGFLEAHNNSTGVDTAVLGGFDFALTENEWFAIDSGVFGVSTLITDLGFSLLAEQAMVGTFFFDNVEIF